MMLPFPEDPFPSLSAGYLRAMQRAARRFPAGHRAHVYAAHAAMLLRDARPGKRACVIAPVDLDLSTAERARLAVLDEEQQLAALIAAVGTQQKPRGGITRLPGGERPGARIIAQGAFGEQDDYTDDDF